MTKQIRPIEDFGIEIFIPQCVHEKPTPIKETRSIAEISKRILLHIKTNCLFAIASVPGRIEPDRGRLGLLKTEFKLSKIRKLCGHDSGVFDSLIFMSMDDMIQRGKLVICFAGIRRFMSHLDVLFQCEFAEVSRTFPPVIEYNILRYYPSEPLTKKERIARSGSIPNITEHVRKIREKRDKYLKDEFGGWSNEAEIEKEIRAIDRAARLELEHAVLALSKNARAPE